MRILLMEKIVVVGYLILIGCADSSTKERKSESFYDTAPVQVVTANKAPSVCNTNFDTTLVRLAKSFCPKGIDVSHSMSNELNQFMLQVDTNCLRRQEKYSFFINVILAKVVLCQLKCCNQHYEMRQERDGATLIVNEFERMAGFQNKRIEFLSSCEVEVYINTTPKLKSNAYLNSIMVKIKKEENRIRSGNI